MRFATFEGESRFSELVDRFFDVPAGRASPLRKAAEDALRDANPQLVDLRRAPRGAPILVPEVPGVEPAPGGPPAATPWGVLVGGLSRAVATAQQSVAESLEQEKKAHDETAELLKSREVREQAKQDPELQGHIERLTAAASARLANSRTGAERRTRGLAALSKDLEAFARDPEGPFATPRIAGAMRQPPSDGEGRSSTATNEERRDVVPHGQSGWAVTRASGEVLSRHRTQAAAEKAAKESLRGIGGQVFVHGRDGVIRDAATVPPANDPRPPRDARQ